jgi:hypothetical protein
LVACSLALALVNSPVDTGPAAILLSIMHMSKELWMARDGFLNTGVSLLVNPHASCLLGGNGGLMEWQLDMLSDLMTVMP